jgi:hypothetical protein
MGLTKYARKETQAMNSPNEKRASLFHALLIVAVATLITLIAFALANPNLGAAGGNGNAPTDQSGGSKNNIHGNGIPPPTTWIGNGVNCNLTPNDPACKDQQVTGCSVNNPQNCPGITQIRGLRLHEGNPHCAIFETQTPPSATLT